MTPPDLTVDDQARPLPSTQENGSDYGDFASDQDELQIVDALLAQIESQSESQTIPLIVTDIEDYEPPRGLLLPKVLGAESNVQYDKDGNKMVRDSRATTSVKRALRSNYIPATKRQSNEPDMRSPIERFRRPPMKALSVTDIISPAWCELQYFYTLAIHGRKKRTPAMKQGTAVHQALEDEVHRTVAVEITTTEDSWGLRIWNVVQGLRTLRETGRTRELEIWGTVGGEIVNGVIDELSYTSPDPRLEGISPKEPSLSKAPPEYQKSIHTYLLSGGKKNSETDATGAVAGELQSPRGVKQEYDQKRIYITDYKTRNSPTLPNGPYVEPTVLQLHLYHHILENLAQGNFSLVQLAERYGLDTNAPFSDAFIAQIGKLNQDLFSTASQSDELAASQALSFQDSIDILLAHNNLSTLWDFMMSQFREIFLLPIPPSNEAPTPTPQSVSELEPPASLPTRLSPLLTAEYIATTYNHAKNKSKTIGKKSFMFNATFLRDYLEDNLAFWRGEREPKGVELQEAFKCRSCDYRSDCSWIHERDAENVAEAMERKRMREVAGLEGKTVMADKSTV